MILTDAGYTYPPNVKPYKYDILQNNGYYAYTEPVAPLKAIVREVINQPIFNVSRETISQYMVPVVYTDTADSYIVFASSGYRVVDRTSGKCYVHVCDNLATLIQDGVIIPDTHATGSRAIIVFQTTISETRLLMMNSASTYNEISNMLLSMGAVNANIIHDDSSAVSLRKGKPIYGDYPTDTYSNLLGFTLAEPRNDIQHLFGKIIQDINYLDATKGTGGGSGDYDDTELRQMIADLQKELDDFKLYVTDTIWINYTDPFTGQLVGRSGVDDIVQDLNTRCLDLANRIIAIGDAGGYDDTELRQRIEVLEETTRELQNRINSVEIKSSTSVVFTGTMEQALQYLYETMQGGGDDELAGRVTTVENRLDNVELKWQGETVISGTIEVVSQWLYEWARQAMEGLQESLDNQRNRITELESKTAQQEIDIANRAVINHASTSNQFGVASATLYGHVMTTNSFERNSALYVPTSGLTFQLKNLVDALTARVTALENSGGGGESDPRFTWIDVTNNSSLDQYYNTGWYRSVPGSYYIYVTYEGTSYYGSLQVINPWEDNSVGGVIEPTMTVVQIFYNTSSDANTSSRARRILTLQRVGYATSRTKPTSYTWTPWVPMVNKQYDGTDPV